MLRRSADSVSASETTAVGEEGQYVRLAVEWTRPIPLKDAAKQNLMYSVLLDKLPPVPGVYVFGRRWGGQFEALYVGKANRIRNRVKVQLNNLRLMQHVKKAKAGKRAFSPGA
jgi:hypothetical protein